MELNPLPAGAQPQNLITLDFSSLVPIAEPEMASPPPLRERKLGKFLYLPVSLSEPIEPFLKLAEQMVSHGFQVLLAPLKNLAKERFGYLPPGIVLFRSALLLDVKLMFQAAQTGGHFCVVSLWDSNIPTHKFAEKVADAFVDDVGALTLPNQLVSLWRRNQYAMPFKIEDAFKPDNDDEPMPYLTTANVRQLGISAWLMA